MLIKSADSREDDVRVLTALCDRPEVDGATKRRIKEEIQRIQAGAKGEREAAYEINFRFADSPNCAVIHDLRLEVGSRVAQIDHLILDRYFDLWVCETKSFAEGVKINDHGEWFRYRRGKVEGMASPIEQNDRHMTVLKDVFDQQLVPLPRRLVLTLKPNLVPVVLVSNEARIDRPHQRAAKTVRGLETVFKVEQLASRFDERFDHRRTVSLASKIVTRGEMLEVARGLAALHRPVSLDWTSRFGLGPASPGTSSPELRTSDPEVRATAVCSRCGAPLTERVVEFCRSNAALFDDGLYCWGHQKAFKRRARS